MKTALITGISGQTGSYLCELLLAKGYTVYGVVRRNSNFHHESPRLDHIRHQDLHLIYGDLADSPTIVSALEQSAPDEIYNLGAQSDVRISFDIPTYTASVNAMGAINLFDSVRSVCPRARVYQASTSEVFGNCIDEDGYQRETTEMRPVSPYGASKLFAYNQARIYRRSFGMHIVNGILFNHESPRRGSNFITHKVVDAAVRISRKQQQHVNLGNLDAMRDWGHAEDHVQAIHKIMQLDTPDDFVVATGITHSVRHLVQYVFEKLDLDWQQHVKIDPGLYRPVEVDVLKGDSSKLQSTTDWMPTHTFESMINQMIEHRLRDN